ncbi:MAG: hypothetical protein QGD92_13745 [Gammaproteobacteria bacterium]|nr:hypothetical protein [Gammaproteobacteria bacterium]
MHRELDLGILTSIEDFIDLTVDSFGEKYSGLILRNRNYDDFLI